MDGVELSGVDLPALAGGLVGHPGGKLGCQVGGDPWPFTGQPHDVQLFDQLHWR